MEDKNSIKLNFGPKPVSNGNFGVSLKIKLDSNSNEYLSPKPEAKPKPFAIELRLKVKPDQTAYLSKTLLKLLNPKRRFRPIPQVFYYAIRERHIEVTVEPNTNEVIFTLLPGEKFLPIANTFLKTFKQYGFENISAKKYDIEVEYSSPNSPEDIIKNHILQTKCGHFEFFRSVLRDSSMNVSYGTDTQATSIIDTFFGLAMENRRIPQFSFFDSVEIETEIDVDSVDYKKRESKNHLFLAIEDFIVSSVSFFNEYSEKELKQIIKLKALLQAKIEDEVSLRFAIPDLLGAEIQIKGSKVLELIEFLAMHPSLDDQKKVQAFYDNWVCAKFQEQ